MFCVEVPPGVVTTMGLAPAVAAGVSAVMEVSETKTMLLADTPPIFTLLFPVKFVPVMVMAVAPRVEPESGLTCVMVGVAK